MAHHGPVLVPDFTLLIQLGIFFLSYWTLRTLVFKPYLELLALRREKTVGRVEASALARATAAKLESEYTVFIRGERQRIQKWLDTERNGIHREEREILQAARDVVAKKLQESRKLLAGETDAARRSLLPLVSDFSSRIASRLLGRNVQVPAGHHPNSPQSSEAHYVAPH